MLAQTINQDFENNPTQLQIIDKNLRGLRDVLSNPSLCYDPDTVGENVNSLVNAFTEILQQKNVKSQSDAYITVPLLDKENAVCTSKESSFPMAEKLETTNIIVNSDTKPVNYHEISLPSSLLAKTSPLAKLGIILLNLNLALSAQDGVGMKFDVPEISQLDPELLESLTVAYNKFQENPINVVVGANNEGLKVDIHNSNFATGVQDNTVTSKTNSTTATIAAASPSPPITSYCSKYNIPIISGPPIPYQPPPPPPSTTNKTNVQNVHNEIHKKVTSFQPSPIKGPRLSQLPSTHPELLSTQDIMFAGGVRKLTTPTTRAKKSMEEEHLLDMGRLQPSNPNDIKTVREIVSADPFHTHYSLEDVFQSFARENEVELQSFIMRRNLGPSHMNGGRGAGLESRVRREVKMERRVSHEYKIPMWS